MRADGRLGRCALTFRSYCQPVVQHARTVVWWGGRGGGWPAGAGGTTGGAATASRRVSRRCSRAPWSQSPASSPWPSTGRAVASPALRCRPPPPSPSPLPRRERGGGGGGLVTERFAHLVLLASPDVCPSHHSFKRLGPAHAHNSYLTMMVPGTSGRLDGAMKDQPLACDSCAAMLGKTSSRS